MNEILIIGFVIVVVLGGGYKVGQWMHENLSGRAQVIGSVVTAVIAAVAGIVVMVFQGAASDCLAAAAC